MSITLRILSGFILLSGIGYYLVFRPAMERVERQYLEAAEEPMVDAAHLLAELFAVAWESADARDATLAQYAEQARRANHREIDAMIYEFRKTRVAMHVYVTDEHGILLCDSGHPERVGENFSARLDVWRTLRGEYGARSTRTDEEDPLTSVMHVAAPILGRDGKLLGVVTVYKPQGSMLEFIESTRRTLQKMGLLAAGAALLAGLLLSQWVSAPLRRLTDYASAVARGERVTLPYLPGRSLHKLGQTLGEMRSALDGRQYVAGYVESLTHEMKSPVAAIRGAAELLEEPMPDAQRVKFLRNIQTETVRLAQLSERLLVLASVETRDPASRRERVNLSALVENCCEAENGLLAARALHLEKQIEPDCQVEGEPVLLEMAVMNLLQNAMEFSPSGGLIVVRLRRSEATVDLVIEDEGPGIPEYARERVFERFYSLPRPDSGKKSSGLGLCFVKEAAVLHAGEIVLNARVGGGTQAIFSLPGQPV